MTVMAAFNDFLRSALHRKQLSFKGCTEKALSLKAFVVSDATAVLGLLPTARPPTLKEPAEHAINAGVDMDMNSRGYIAFYPRKAC